MDDFDWIREHDTVMTKEELDKCLSYNTPYELVICDDDCYVTNKEKINGRRICFFWLKDVKKYNCGYRMKDIVDYAEKKMKQTSVWTMEYPNGKNGQYGIKVEKFSKEHYSRVECAKNYRELYETLKKLI